jgi:hypothetical protein
MERNPWAVMFSFPYPMDLRATRIVFSLMGRPSRLSEMRSFAEHIKNDRPVDAIAGEWALRAVIFLAGAGGWWLLSRAPKIWELLK